MSVARFAFYALWITPALLMAVLAVVMMRKGFRRELPAFFAYAVFTAVRAPILLYVFRQHWEIYWYFYSIADGISAGLGFAAIYEVFRRLFQGNATAYRLGTRAFQWTTASFVLLGVLLAALEPPQDTNRLFVAVLALTQGVRLVQCGLVLFLFIFSFFFGLPLRNRFFGIAAGFGLFAGVQLATAAMFAHLGMVTYKTVFWINMASYNCAVLVWVGYVLAPQRVEVAAPAPVHAEVKSWNQALLQLLQR